MWLVELGIQEKDKKTNESVITVFSFIVFISNFSNNRIDNVLNI